MTSIISPKLIAIDTSILGKVAKDYYSKTESRRKEAQRFLLIFEDRGLIPLFCMHHFQELLQHKDDSVANNRLSLIKRFSQVAWIKPSSKDGLVGSIIDVQGTEITKLIKNPNLEIETLIAEIRTELISYSSGESFINSIYDELITLRKMNLFSTGKSKTVSSISHIRNSSIDNMKLSELYRSQLNSPIEFKESMELLRKNYKQQLQRIGDRKLENIDEIIHQFLESVAKQGLKFYEPTQDSLYKKFINSSGIGEHEVDENWTIGQLGDYAIFKEKINIISRSYNFDIEKALKLPQNAIPSWFVWFELVKKTKDEKFASGSNVIDKYLASLAFYSDILIVDKRINEYLKQILKRHKKYSFINDHIMKLSRYENFRQHLDTLN